MDECFPQQGFSGGGHKVSKNIILGLIESGLFEIDIFCKKGSEKAIEGINSVTVIGKKDFETRLKKRLSQVEYDYIISSDVLLPFGNQVIHSNSSKYKTKNGKNKFLQPFLALYNFSKIRKQQNCFTQNKKAVFTVSNRVREEYIDNYRLDESKVFCAHPGIDEKSAFAPPIKKENFIIGSIAGGGLNKGGYLLLLALSSLPERINLKARIIFPKLKKAFFFKIMIKLLSLQDRIELMGKQEDMSSFYQSIDCYVLPSLNEAFGLVVTEAASNSRLSIVSSCAGVQELIQDGINGFVFDRIKNPVKNLKNKLIEVSDIYLNNNQKFIEISKEAFNTSQKLDWKNFVDIIIKNMIGEKVD